MKLLTYTRKHCEGDNSMKQILGTSLQFLVFASGVWGVDNIHTELTVSRCTCSVSEVVTLPVARNY